MKYKCYSQQPGETHMQDSGLFTLLIRYLSDKGANLYFKSSQPRVCVLICLINAGKCCESVSQIPVLLYEP